MGFFSGISGLAGSLGGSATQGAKSSTQSGFALLPQSIQNAFTGYGTQVSNLFSDPTSAQQMFTPVSKNQYETQALGNISQGVAPTQASLNNDISMQMNPYDSYVTDAINREANGQNSLVNQAATQAGQQGSNRSFLGTSDVEQNRLNSIGQFKQQQYNQALSNALGPIANLKQQDISNLLGAGTFQRGLDTQTQQAPYAALQAYGGLLGALPQNGGSISNSNSSQQGASDGIGGIVQGAGTLYNAGSVLASFFSDKRLKENIISVGEENGHKIYEFSYKGNSARFIGVMAQEVQETNPEAVEEIDGYLAVDYDKIGVKMREV